MNKILGPDFISFQVHDLEASKRFYVERLGLVPALHSPPNAVVFDTHPIPFAIRKPLADLDASEHLGWGVALWLACDDADALSRTMEKTGVPIIKPLADGPFGRFFIFSDPDGYSVTVHTKQ